MSYITGYFQLNGYIILHKKLIMPDKIWLLLDTITIVNSYIIPKISNMISSKGIKDKTSSKYSTDS